MARRRAQVGLALLLGCGSTGGPVDGSAGTGGTDGETMDTATGSASSASTASAGTTAGSASTGGSEPPEDYEEQCLAQTDREGCQAVPYLTGTDPNGLAWDRFCHWVQWVPVDPATCAFGEPHPGSCSMGSSGSEGCAGTAACADGTPVWQDGPDGLEIALTHPCAFVGNFCNRDESGEITGPPGCACVCDPAFPG